jgi:hypothetical protein
MMLLQPGQNFSAQLAAKFHQLCRVLFSRYAGSVVFSNVAFALDQSKSEQAGLGQMIHYQLSTLHSQLFCTAATASKR